MKIQLELNSETLAEFRAELVAFLSPSAAAAAPMVNTTTAVATEPVIVEPVIDPVSTSTIEIRPDATDTVVAASSVADVALGPPAPGDTVMRSALPPAPKKARARSAADIALGLDPEADTVATAAGTIGLEARATPHPDIEDLLADKAQLNFDFDRVLALQGRAAALGIVRGVLPTGTKTKLKDLETLPVALIPAAIAALQAAQEA